MSSCPAYDAKIRLLESFSRKTLNDDVAVDDWIAMFTTWPIKPTPGLRCQLDVSPQTNRLPAYRNIAAPVLVIGFADDVVTPPYLGREVADALPNGRYLQIPDAGHLGFFERPGGRQRGGAAVLRRQLNFGPTSTARQLTRLVETHVRQAYVVTRCSGEPLDDTGPRRR